ncbi:MAG: ribbon-helix-helix protein, CopG family [Chloroflexales bacterium]|nr:ribbon-helix-helix protein, CopG family [Chloroflexales bacterium]
MPSTVTLGTRVTSELRNQVDEIARVLRRERSWIVEEAVRRYIAEQAAFIAAVRRGQEDAQAGRVTPHEDVMQELDRIIDEAPEPMQA